MSDRDGNYEIYTMNADGTGQTRVSNNGANDTLPDWSPHGDRIVFGSNRDGNYEIYMMYANGTGQTRLTANAAYDSSPAWSPDGLKIAFLSDRDAGTWEIYTMNADGTGQTNRSNNPTLDELPDWQPGSAVGGIAELPDAPRAAPQVAESSGGSSTPYAVAAFAAGVVALGGAAWYARRRWRAG